jgi:hypothetical protein
VGLSKRRQWEPKCCIIDGVIVSEVKLNVMSDSKFEKSWIVAIVIGAALFSFPLLAVLHYLGELIVYWEYGMGQLFWQFLPELKIVVPFFTVWTIVVVAIYVRALTLELSENGISMKGLLRSKFIAWEEITSIKIDPTGTAIAIYVGRKKTVLPMWFFKNGKDVYTYIFDHIAPDEGRQG